MSKRSETVAAEMCVALGATEARVESYPNRELTLGPLAIVQALPVKNRRLVGPWCFLDRFGPLTFSGGTPMDAAPHPHIDRARGADAAREHGPAERRAALGGDWEDCRRFGDVAAYKGPRLSAPSLVRFARPNPVS